MQALSLTLGLLCWCWIFPAQAAEQVNLVRVLKSERKLQLIASGKVLQEFHIVLGSQPLGHKQQEGDGRTPEGKYLLDYKKADSGFYKAIHISYPNTEDTSDAKRRGKTPGGLVMLHGQKNGFGWWSWLTQRFDWTNGCVALADADMERVWQMVAVKTPIELLP